MKKTAVLLIGVLLLLCTFINVSAKEDLDTYEEITPETYSLMEKTDEDVLNTYLKKEGYIIEYINDLKVSICRNLNDESEWKMMYKPSLISYKGEPAIVYTSTDGLLMYWNLNYSVSNSEVASNSAHVEYDEEDGDILLETNINQALVFNQKMNDIKCWSNNMVVKKISLQEGAVFCGKTQNLGYIFRCENDVYTYTANCYATTVLGEELKVIAHDVKSVIISNYGYDDLNLEAPLFLMMDGTLKAYVNNDENLGEKLDAKEY